MPLSLEQQIPFMEKHCRSTNNLHFRDVLFSLQKLQELNNKAQALAESQEESKPESLTAFDFYIGQRVILNSSEIGTITTPENDEEPANANYIWVFSPKKKYASRYNVMNVQPLPNGQL